MFICYYMFIFVLYLCIYIQLCMYAVWCILMKCNAMQCYVMACHGMACHVMYVCMLRMAKFEVLSYDRNLGRGWILSNGTLASGSPRLIHWQVQPSPSKQLACSILCQAVTSGAHPNGEIMFNYIYIYIIILGLTNWKSLSHNYPTIP